MNKSTFVVCVASISLVIAGCGGSSSSSGGGSVNVNGGITSTIMTATKTYDASLGDVTVTDDSGKVIGILPSGFVINTGEPFSVVPAGVPLIQELLLGARAPGDVVVNGVVTGVHVTNRADGSLVNGAQLDKPLVLPSSKQFTVDLIGPFTLGTGANKLNIANAFHFAVKTADSGANSLPSQMIGTLPGNGSDVAKGFVVQVAVSTAFAGGMFNLRIVHSAGSLDQTNKLTTAGWVSFVKPLDTANGIIPAAGVSDVYFSAK